MGDEMVWPKKRLWRSEFFVKAFTNEQKGKNSKITPKYYLGPIYKA